MFIWSSIYSALEFWSKNHTSVYENSESKVKVKSEKECQELKVQGNVKL